MILDSEQQRKDFAEFVQKYPAPTSVAGYNVINTYLPLVQNAAIIPEDKQQEFVDKVFPSKKEEPDASKKG